ncbi:hypothetical protein C8Q74DRAFT_402830 [Fomes fomentarius]|nr:hypothetical protein C8Q74DRAFT_402830 [Fomes fomentarius]
MFFTTPALVAALFSLAVQASPAPAPDTVAPGTTTSTNPSDFPVANIGSLSPKPDVSGVNTAVALAEFPATLLLFRNLQCSGQVTQVNLSATPANECFVSPSDFNSVAVSQPSNQGLPFGVGVGPSPCQQFAQIPRVNTCFNINGGPFSDYTVD